MPELTAYSTPIPNTLPPSLYAVLPDDPRYLGMHRLSPRLALKSLPFPR